MLGQGLPVLTDGGIVTWLLVKDDLQLKIYPSSVYEAPQHQERCRFKPISLGLLDLHPCMCEIDGYNYMLDPMRLWHLYIFCISCKCC